MFSEDKLPAGITHIAGKVYRVPLNMKMLNFADGSFNKEKLEFRNIRHALIDQKFAGRGMSKEEMTSLRERIRTEGLLHTPLLRWYGDGVQVIAGERRIKCLLKLAADNEKCFDRAKGEFVPGKDLYSTLDCEVHEIDDRQAFKYSFSETESSVHFGDGAKVAAIAYFRSCGEKDKDIIGLTGLGAEWLGLADKISLGSLGQPCWTAFCNNEMNLQVAIQLIGIADESKRLEKFNEWKKHAEGRFSAKKEKLEASLAKAETAVENAGEVVSALETEEGAITDANAIASLKEKIGKQKKKQDKASERRATVDSKMDKLKKKGPKVTAADIGGPKRLTFAKIEKHWLEPVLQFVKNNGLDADGKQIHDVDMHDVRLVKFLIEQMRKGQVDIFRILASHYKRKQEN